MLDNRTTPQISTHDLYAVLRLFAASDLTQQEQAQVLGLELPALRRAWEGTLPDRLSPEQHDRLRLSVAIVTALAFLYDGKAAAGWFRRVNERPPFDGSTPLAFILGGGMPALLTTERVLAGDLNGQFSATTVARALASTLPQPAILLDSTESALATKKPGNQDAKD